MDKVSDAIWASCYKQQLDAELIKALVAHWSPCTKTFLTYYVELGISLWDVFLIIGLPIVEEMYDDFFS